MDDATMEQYADWLDNLERTDPAGYKQLLTTMKAQIEGGAAEMPPQRDADAALFDMLSNATKAAGDSNSSSATNAFTPRFPGNKVMESSGLAVQHEGMYIDVQPGFVMKTREVKTNKKVFVNVCYSDDIQSFSQQKKLDDDGIEQEGIHVPLSLGAPHDVTDKRGAAAIAFDVAVNSRVVDDCREDATGAFRHFVCELAIEYVDQKYKVKLAPRYKLPRLAYCGQLPPPQHYIRKIQTPGIQEVTTTKAVSTVTTAAKAAKAAKADTTSLKTAVATYEVHEVDRGSGKRTKCLRVAAADKLSSSCSNSSAALSPLVLAHAGDALDVTVRFVTPVRAATDVTLELRPELLAVKARGHEDLSVFLPYPVVVDSAHVTLSRAHNSLRLRFTIDKTWDVDSADIGSTPWLLAQALRGDTDSITDSVAAAAADPTVPVQASPSKSLAELFHLERAASSDCSSARSAAKTATTYDPVDDDDELPEDRFHRQDMLSMHILEQRRAERTQKALDAETKRRAQRADVQAKQKQAAAAGKTWREMFPNEPETTFVDVDDVLTQQRTRRGDEAVEKTPMELQATADAERAAAAWAKNDTHKALALRSALAFDLLE